MAPWQVLRASRASQAALGYRVHHGAGVTVHYSTAPATPAGPDSGRSFCLSGEKHSLQQLNRRLAVYLQQVQILEADNQRLEQQIQAELDKKCPRQLRQLDRHLRTVSLLQDQISECLSAQAQVKLQLLEEELRVYELNIRCEKERERSCDLEAELSTLRLIEEELNVHALPEIQSLLNELTQQQVELQIRHQQEMQVLQVQASGGVTVEMQTAESSDLVKQLDHLRKTSVTLIDKNHNEPCFSTRVMAFGPPVGSEVDQAELEELRRTVITLTEELKQLQTLIVELDLSGQEKTETFVLQLVFLQQTADSLCRDLDSVLQAAAQQAADLQALLDIKSHMETEIQGYRRLLDGLSHQGVSDLASTSACVATCPYVFRTNITSGKAFRVQSGNVRTMEVQNISRGHVNTAGPTQLSQTVKAVQPISVHSKHPKSSPIPSINTLGCVHASELQNSLIVRDEISQGLEEGPAVKTSTTKIISTQFPDSKPETSKQADLLDAEIGTNIQVDITKIVPYAEPEVDKAETGTVNLGQMDHIEDCELETPLEVSESDVHRSEMVQGEVSDGMNLMDDWNIERQEHKHRDNLLGDTDAGSNLTSARSGCPNNLENHDGRTTGTEILKAEEDGVEVVHETSKVQSTVLDDLARQETLDGSTDSGVALSSYSLEDFASQKEAHESISPTKPDTQLNPEMSQIPVESPNDIEMHPGSNGSEPHLNPVEAATLVDDKDMESQGKKRKQEAEGSLVIPILVASSPLSEVSNPEPNTPREDTRSNIANASSGSIDSTDVLKTEETKLRAVGGFHTNMVKVDPTDLENGLVGLAIQETSKMSSGLDSGLALSPAGPEEFLSTKEAQSPSESPEDPEMYLHSDIYLHPTEAEATVADKDTERQEHKEGVGTELVPELNESSGLSDVSNSGDNLVENTDTGSSLTSARSGCPNSLGNHDGRTTGTEILKAEEDGMEVVHETSKVKVQSTVLDDLARQETLGGSTDSGVSLSSYSLEDFASQKEAHESISPTKPDTQLNPEMSQIPVQSPKDIEMHPGSNGSEPHLNPVEAATLMDDKDMESQGKKRKQEAEGPLVIPRLDASSPLSEVSNPEPNTPREDTRSTIANAPSGSTDSTDVLKTEETKLRAVGGFHTNMVKVDPTDLENRLAGLAIQEPTNMSSGLDFGLALSPAGPEEFTKEAQSPDDPEMYLHSDTCVHPTEAEATVTDKGTERQEHKGVGEEVVTDTGSSLTSDIFGCPNSLGNHDGRTTGTETLKAEEDGGEVVHETSKAKVHSTELGDLAGQEALDGSAHSGVALSFYSHEDFANQKEADVLASPTSPETQANPEMCDNGLDGIAIQEPSKISSSLTDSGLALSSSGPEEYPSTKEAQSPPDEPEMYLHSDTYLHSSEAEATLADKDTERQEHKEEEEISEGTLTVPVLDPHSLLSDVSHLELNKPMEDTDAGSGTATPLSGCTNSTDNIDGPDDPEMSLRPNDSDTRLSPVELKMRPSSNCEEDEEACLSLTEANTHVRPVEKYVLSTRETGQRSSFSGDQASPDEGRNTKVILSESQGRGLGFRPFKGSEIRSVALNGTNISSRPTSESTSIQVCNRHGSLGFGGPGGQSIIADKEEQLGFGGLYWKRQRDKDRSGTADENKQQRLDIENNVRKQTNSRQVVNKPGSSERVFNKSEIFASSDRGTTFRSEASKSGGDIHSDNGIISGNAHNATSNVQGRFRHGSAEWMIYGGSLGRTSANLTNPRSEEYLPADTLPASSLPATGRFGSRGSGEWTVYGGSLRRKSSLDGGTSLSSKGNEESQPEGGRFSRRGSGEWMVYGGSLGSKSNLTSSDSLPNAVSKEYQPTAVNIPTIPPGAGRFGSGGSGEWKVYGWSTGRLSSAGSGGQLSSGSVVRRSSSVGSGGRLSGSGSGGRLSSSPGSHRISSSRRLSSTGSGEWKPVYSSASGSKISVGSTVRPGGGRTTSSQRTPSPGGRIGGVSGGSGGWLNCSAAGGKQISSAGSGSRHSSTSSNERISGRSGGRISSSSGSGRTNSTGGRVISSSDRPIGSTGSGAGSNKERISVCKMAALTISAAGRERSKERRKHPQRSQHQQAAVSSPLIQRWLTTSVGVMTADPQGTDDIMHF